MNNIPKQNIYSFSLKPEDYKISNNDFDLSKIKYEINFVFNQTIFGVDNNDYLTNHQKYKFEINYNYLTYHQKPKKIIDLKI
jgi:hypothetical protein